LDDQTEKDDQAELYTVLGRIRDVLESRPYQFANLSVGPDLAIEDNEVHAWTSRSGPVLASGRILASIAVGNTGENDHASGKRQDPDPGGLRQRALHRRPATGTASSAASGIQHPSARAAARASSSPTPSPSADPAMSRSGRSASPSPRGRARHRHELRLAGGAPHRGIGNPGPISAKSLRRFSLKALLLHAADDGGHRRAETG